MRRPVRIVGALLAMAGVAVAIRKAGPVLVVADPLPARADAIVMLAGSLADRALETSRLYATGVAPRIVLTRERARPEVAELAARGVRLPDSASVAAETLVRLGVPPGAVVTLPPETDSTVAEARVVAAWACNGAARSLVVVTSPSHARRARAIFRRALGDAVDVSMQPARAAEFPAATWWRERWAAKAVALEWQKLTTWWLVERWGVAPCAPSLVSDRPPS